MSERKKAIIDADKWFSLYIRERDKRCVICGKTVDLTCGHLFSRVSHSTRWEELNGYCQCKGCNLRHEHDPLPLIRFAENKYGIEAIDDLHRMWRQSVKYNEEALLEIAEHYKSKYQSLNKSD